MVSEFGQTGVTFPWERNAMNGEEIPDNCTGYPNHVLYLELRNLYSQLRQGIIDRPTGIREKKRLLEEYRVYSFREKMGKQWVDVIKKTDLARCEYRKNRTLENADKLVCTIEGG